MRVRGSCVSRLGFPCHVWASCVALFVTPGLRLTPHLWQTARPPPLAQPLFSLHACLEAGESLVCFAQTCHVWAFLVTAVLRLISLRKGGPISYEARPSGFFPAQPGSHPHPPCFVANRVTLPQGTLSAVPVTSGLRLFSLSYLGFVCGPSVSRWALIHDRVESMVHTLNQDWYLTFLRMTWRG